MSYLLHCFQMKEEKKEKVFDPWPGIDQNSVRAHESVHVCGGELWQGVHAVHTNAT